MNIHNVKQPSKHPKIESYRISMRKLPNFLKRINQGLHRLCIFITSELYKYAKQVIMPRLKHDIRLYGANHSVL